MSTLLFIHRGWISSMSKRRKVKYVRRKCFCAWDTHLRNSMQTSTWHSKERAESSMVLSHGRSTISLPKSEWERSNKKKYFRRFLTASRMTKYFMQARYNITGQKNGTNIWIKLGQSILHTMPLRNNENDTLRYIIFGTIQKYGERPYEKSSRLSRKHYQHEQRSGSKSTSSNG